MHPWNNYFTQSSPSYQDWFSTSTPDTTSTNKRGGSPAPAPPRLPLLTSNAFRSGRAVAWALFRRSALSLRGAGCRAPSRPPAAASRLWRWSLLPPPALRCTGAPLRRLPCAFGRAPPSLIGNPTPPNVQRTDAGGSPAPLVLPPRAAVRRPYAGVGLASGYRSRSSVHHRFVFGRWPCSPLGLRSPLPALVHRGFAARFTTIALRSCRRCRSIDQRSSVVPFRATARFITPAAVVRAHGRVGLGARASGPSRRPASSLGSSACVLRYAWPQPRAHGAPSSGARFRWSRAPLLGRTFATRAQLCA